MDTSREALKSIPEDFKIVKVHARLDESLPLKDNFADLILFVEVLEHLENPDRAPEEIHRVLKPSGILVLSTPNFSSIWNRFLLVLGLQPLYSEVSTRRIFGRPGSDVVGHLRLFTLRALHEFLNYYGFKIISESALPLYSGNKKIFYFASIIEKFLITINNSIGSRVTIWAKK